MESDPAPVQPESPARVSPAERRFVLIFGAVVMLAVTLPYLLGYALQGQGFRFTGFVFGVEDGNSYIAKMLSGWAGAYLFRSPYNVYSQRGLLFYLPYLLLGKLAAPPALHEQLVALYHLFRIAAGMLSILAVYDFLAYFIRAVLFRRIGLALAVLGGGLGWILVASGRAEWLGSPPLDFISPESFGFLGIYGVAHLPLGRALLLWAFVAYLELSRRVLKQDPKSQTRDNSVWRQVFKLGAFWLASGFFNPLCLLIGGVVIAIHLGGLLVWRGIRPAAVRGIPTAAWRRLAVGVIAAGALPGLLLAYNLLIARIDPYASQWNAQNRILSPHPLHYLVAYGLLIPYAWVGGRRLLREDFSKGWFLVGWVLAIPVLVTLPVNLQRRLTEGAWIAVCTLGMAALEKPAFSSSAQESPRLGWRPFPLLLAFPTALFLLAGGVMSVLKPGPPLFITADQERVFIYLQQNAPPGAVALSAYETANPLTAWAPVHVLVGHGPESINKAELLPRIQSFFEISTPSEERARLIDEFKIDYVIWGPAEMALGGWQPAEADYLEAAADSGEITLFRVVSPLP